MNSAEEESTAAAAAAAAEAAGDEAGGDAAGDASVPCPATDEPAAAPARKRRRWEDKPAESAAAPPAAPVPTAGPLATPALAVDAATQQAAADAIARMNQMLTGAEPSPGLLRKVTKTVDVNDSPCKGLLTRKQTHEEVEAETGAIILIRGRFKPPGDTSDEKPLHLLIEGPTKEVVDSAEAKIHALMALMSAEGGAPPNGDGAPPAAPSAPAAGGAPTFNLAPLGIVPPPAEPPQPAFVGGVLMGGAAAACAPPAGGSAYAQPMGISPYVPAPPLPPTARPGGSFRCVVAVGMDPSVGYQIRGKLLGPKGSYIRHIQDQTGVRVQLVGKGSNNTDRNAGIDENSPLSMSLSGPSQEALDQAKQLAEHLIQAVKEDFKARAASGAPPKPSTPYGGAMPPGHSGGMCPGYGPPGGAYGMPPPPYGSPPGYPGGYGPPGGYGMPPPSQYAAPPPGYPGGYGMPPPYGGPSGSSPPHPPAPGYGTPGAYGATPPGSYPPGYPPSSYGAPGGGYGQPPSGYEQQPPQGYGQPPPQGYEQQPPPAYGQPPADAGYAPMPAEAAAPHDGAEPPPLPPLPPPPPPEDGEVAG